MTTEIYKGGPLKGMASVNVLISEHNLKIMKIAAHLMERSIEDLATAAVEEGALNYARTADLLPEGRCDVLLKIIRGGQDDD